MPFNSFVYTLINLSFRQSNWFLSAEVIFIIDGRLNCSSEILKFAYVHIHQELTFLRIVEFLLIQVLHYEEVFRIFLFQIQGVDHRKIRFVLCNAVSMMVAWLKYIFKRIAKYFHFLSNSYFKSNQSDVKFLVEYHANVFELESFVQLGFQWYSIKFILHTCYVIRQPFIFLSKVCNFVKLVSNILLLSSWSL